MYSEITGRVVAVPPAVTGSSQKGPWGRQIVVIEFASGNYTKTLALENMPKYQEFGQLRIGQTVKFKFDVTSREYNGKYYTTANAFQWEVQGGGNAPQPAAGQGSSDLPF